MDLIYVEEVEEANLWLLSAPASIYFPPFPFFLFLSVFFSYECAEREKNKEGETGNSLPPTLPLSHRYVVVVYCRGGGEGIPIHSIRPAAAAEGIGMEEEEGKRGKVQEAFCRERKETIGQRGENSPTLQAENCKVHKIHKARTRD